MNKDLLIRAKDGDKAAMEEILTEYRPLVLSSARNVYINGYEREDLIQIGYLSVMKAIKSFDPSSDSFSSYVKNSVKNNFYYLIRGKARLNYEGALEDDILSEENLEETVINCNQADRLKEALQKLSDEDKMLIDFLFFKGYTLNKCAAILDSSKSTISRRKDKILGYLRIILK